MCNYTLPSEFDAIIALKSYESGDSSMMDALVRNLVVLPFNDIPSIRRRHDGVCIDPWHKIHDGALILLPSVFSTLSNSQRVSVSKTFEDYFRNSNSPEARKYRHSFVLNNCYADPIIDDNGEYVFIDGQPSFKVSLISPTNKPISFLSGATYVPTMHGTQSMFRADATISLPSLYLYCSWSLASWYNDAWDAWSRRAARSKYRL